MYFNKYQHPKNFNFLGEDCLDAESLKSFSFKSVGDGNGVYHVSVNNAELWPENYCCSELTPFAQPDTSCTTAQSRLSVGEHGSFRLQHNDDSLLSTLTAAFGVCGNSWMFQFEQHADMQFYGMGEKSTPFEKSGRVHKFWNTDAWADFDKSPISQAAYDPDYISIPYVIIKQKNRYCAILIDNPYPSYISISPSATIANQTTAIGVSNNALYLGAENGQPSLYILYGPSLPELTRKMQNLTGKSALPPVWALGFHQCRWGYAGIKDLEYLADSFELHQFPVSGLWLDIDYMDGFRVFTHDTKHFPDIETNLKSITDRGYKVIPIVDPGVKQEIGYSVYDSGTHLDVFCKNAAGKDFIGMVWPGYTAFPDFSLEQTQTWWAQKYASLLKAGFSGAWLDMNDPSTGPVDCGGMLFKNGTVEHAAFHNQYAMLMSKASYAGALQAFPNKRPFLIARSGFTGSQKYSGNWTGDNCSNYAHLSMSIGKSINLALSGMPFNGPDVGGFGGDTNEQLMLDWMKAGFLFPFLRNHTCMGTKQQEPWEFSDSVHKLLRRYVRLRYTLMPYIYNLFINQAIQGEAILRPLFYDFEDTDNLALGTIDDQCMIGPSIMQAPFVKEKEKSRTIVLPNCAWYRADTLEWVSGNQIIKAEKKKDSTPLFIREGAIIPLQPGIRLDNAIDLTNIEFLLCVAPNANGTWRYVYTADDGESFEYRNGTQSTYEIVMSVNASELTIDIKTLSEGYKPVRFFPLTLNLFEHVSVCKDGNEVPSLKKQEKTIQLFGAKQKIWKYGK